MIYIKQTTVKSDKTVIASTAENKKINKKFSLKTVLSSIIGTIGIIAIFIILRLYCWYKSKKVQNAYQYLHLNRLNSNLNHFDLNEQNNDSFDDDIVGFTCKICKMNLRLEQISDFDDHARNYHFKIYRDEMEIVKNDRSELLNLINLRKISNKPNIVYEK